ncbi:MAG: glutamate synthase (NADPH/NADH) small chain [Cyclobacteriaceae bacterium]|jgi:glutamate synthase (NADPH/NADH) small chain
MGVVDGFLKYDRELPKSRNPKNRIDDYKEIYQPFAEEKTNKQAARCMDCGIPFCHNGCPLGNQIPDFNDAVFNEDWESASDILSSTNNFPEFTGRICPAPCEASCVLGINKNPVAIELIEKSIAEMAFEKGYIKANPPKTRTGKSIAVVGSGPAGLAAAAQLNQAGHNVTVFERAERIGGLLRYGIPDFKLEKWTIDRRLAVMEEEGINFKTNANVGVNITVDSLKADYDAILLSGGSTVPRELPLPGKDLKGIFFAMDFLSQQNNRVTGSSNELINHMGKDTIDPIMATDKNIVVIGGGDTGSDCVGTSNRHGAKSVTQIELLSKPPTGRTNINPWPEWPMTLRTSSSHEEGCERDWSVLTKEFVGNEKGELVGIKIVKINWVDRGFEEIEGTEEILPCELALLAAGFVHPEKEGVIEQLSIDLDERGNVKTNEYQTSDKDVFAAGDMRRGQSLVVWAISEGREAARALDIHLMGASLLPSKKESYFKLS